MRLLFRDRRGEDNFVMERRGLNKGKKPFEGDSVCITLNHALILEACNTESEKGLRVFLW